MPRRVLISGLVTMSTEKRIRQTMASKFGEEGEVSQVKSLGGKQKRRCEANESTSTEEVITERPGELSRGKVTAAT